MKEWRDVPTPICDGFLRIEEVDDAQGARTIVHVDRRLIGVERLRDMEKQLGYVRGIMKDMIDNHQVGTRFDWTIRKYLNDSQEGK